MFTIRSAKCRSMLVLSAALVSLTGFSPAPQTIHILVDDPRPLAEAILSLEAQLGWTITYEDPRYVYWDDSVDVTLTVSKSSERVQPRILIPRGGIFYFSHSLIADPSKQKQDLLEALLKSYAATLYPGVFAVRNTGSTFHVVPTKFKNAVGDLEAYTPILDGRISIDVGDRTAMELVDAIVAKSDGRLWVGRVPTNLLRQTKVNVSANNEPARQVLLRTLEATGRNLSWQVFCDPSNRFPCALNIHVITQTK